MKDTKEAKIFLDAFSGARKAFQSFVALGKPTEDFASKRDHILMGFINRKITYDAPSSANDSQTTQSKDNNTKARNSKTGDKKTSPTNKATPSPFRPSHPNLVEFQINPKKKCLGWILA